MVWSLHSETEIRFGKPINSQLKKGDNNMRTIAVMNVKGGVGKTVTTVNMASVLAELYGKRVLVIDADGQGDSSAFLGADTSDGAGLPALFQGTVTTCAEIAEHTGFSGVDLISGNSDLFTIDLDALRMGKDAGRCVISDLRDAVIEDDAYDVILIDCPPSFTACSVAALAAADGVIIPVKLDAFSVRGMSFLIDQIRALHRVNGRCRVDGVLVTQWHNVDVIHQAEKMLRDKGVPVFSTHIRRTDKVDESTWYCEPLQVYSRYSSAGVDYRSFVAEWVRKGGLGDGV